MSVASAAFDSGRQRLVLLEDGQAKTFTTWEWDGRSWARRTLPAAPPYRRDFGLAYDEHRRRTVLFGGHEPAVGEFSDTWEYDGFTWERRTPAVSPPGRHEHGFAYDPNRRRIVLFGGYGQGPRNDTWEWDGATWSQIAAVSRPSPRVLPGMSWDPSRGAILLFGGFDHATTSVNDTWTWDGTTWTRLSPPTSPPARVAPTMGADMGRRRVVLFGGWYGLGPIYRDTWEWDGITWREIQRSAGPMLQDSRWVYPRLLYVPARGRLLFVGGTQLWNDLWEWDGSSWSHAASIDEGPDPLSPIAYDAGRERVVQASRGRTLEWDGVKWEPRAMSSFHPNLLWAAMVYDLSRKVCVLFGSNAVTRTWEWDGSAWKQFWPSPQPSVSVYDLALAYDVVRRQTVFFGGRSPTLGLLGETWVWDGTAWTRLPVPNGPSPRSGHAMAYDIARGRVVLFGGTVQAQADDTWEWDGSRWTLLQPTTKPQARSLHSMAYDPIRRRIVLYGGSSSQTYFDDTWEFDGQTWRKINVQTGYAWGSPMAYDVARQRMVMVGMGKTWLYGNPIAAAASIHGTGCGPGGGPRLEPFGIPWLGHAGFGCDLHRARPVAPALLTVSFGEVDLQLGGGCRLYVDAGQIGVVAAAATNGDGFAHVPLGVPRLPQLTGLRLFGQSIVLDPQGPWLGLSFSPGMRLVIGD